MRTSQHERKVYDNRRIVLSLGDFNQKTFATYNAQIILKGGDGIDLNGVHNRHGKSSYTVGIDDWPMVCD